MLTLSQWKVLIVDEDSKRILDNVLKQDDILNENITSELRLGAKDRGKSHSLQMSRILKTGGRGTQRSMRYTFSQQSHIS